MSETIDQAVRRTAFGLLVRDAEPIPPSRLAAALADPVDPTQLDDALARLAAAGLIDREPSGAVIGAGGLTLGDGPHRLLLGERDYRTWCAYDAIGIGAAIGGPGGISTRCAVCHRPIALALPLTDAADRPERLWLAAGGANMREDFCAPTVLLCSPEHADAWAAQHDGRGRILALRSAWRLGAGAWAGYAAEATRLAAGSRRAAV